MDSRATQSATDRSTETRACVQEPPALFKTPDRPKPAIYTPEKRQSYGGPFGLDDSPSERSTIPQLFTPEINTLLDLDASIRLRSVADPGGMSPLPAVTPLVVPTGAAHAGAPSADGGGAAAQPSKAPGDGAQAQAQAHAPAQAQGAQQAQSQLGVRNGQQLPQGRGLRSHRALDFSNANGFDSRAPEHWLCLMCRPCCVALPCGKLLMSCAAC